MEGSVKGIRKRKLSKSSKDVVVVDARVPKFRKTSLDKEKPLLQSKSKNNKTIKNGEESVGLDNERYIKLCHLI
jgi:hypothetical protein